MVVLSPVSLEVIKINKKTHRCQTTEERKIKLGKLNLIYLFQSAHTGDYFHILPKKMFSC